VTIEAWVNWSGSTTIARQLIYAEGYAPEVVGLFLINGAPAFAIRADSGGTPINWQITAPNVLSAGVWHQVAAVLDPGAGSFLYVDGLLEVDNLSMRQASVVSTPDVTIGATVAPADFFSGIVDELRVFTYARSAMDIENDYLMLAP